MRFFMQTFGCQMNENDSDMISGMLKTCQHQQVDQIDMADIIIINTCCVRQNAENRAIGFIGNLKKLKSDNPNLVIVVCGCMAQKPGNAENLYKIAKHVGIIIGTFAATNLPKYIEEYTVTGNRIIDIEERYDNKELCRLGHIDSNDVGFKSQVNIIYGCNNFCSYCIVPYVRGRERSRKAEEIIAEIESLVAAGVKEIQLLGQNVNSYGNDLDGNWDFAALLKEVNRINGLERIRFMTSHPRDFSHKLIDTIAQLEKVCHQFHLPIQSGCNRLLKLMNRGYTTEYYFDMINYIREIMPDAVITSDLLVGFPGETEDDFAETLDFIAKCKLDAAYTFIYSPRSGTPAAEIINQIPDNIKKQRLQMLMDVQNPISLSINRQDIGKVQRVLVEGLSKNNSDYMSGRNYGNKIVIFPAVNSVKPGDIKDIKITDAQTWHLCGESL